MGWHMLGDRLAKEIPEQKQKDFPDLIRWGDVMQTMYGGGYLLDVQARDDAEAQRELQEFVRSEFGGIEVEGSRHFGRSRFRLSTSGPGLASVFRSVEKAKLQLGILQYSVSQPTLEQVFLTVIGELLHD